MQQQTMQQQVKHTEPNGGSKEWHRTTKEQPDENRKRTKRGSALEEIVSNLLCQVLMLVIFWARFLFLCEDRFSMQHLSELVEGYYYRSQNFQSGASGYNIHHFSVLVEGHYRDQKCKRGHRKWCPRIYHVALQHLLVLVEGRYRGHKCERGQRKWCP